MIYIVVYDIFNTIDVINIVIDVLFLVKKAKFIFNYVILYLF